MNGIKVYFENNRINAVLAGDWTWISSVKEELKYIGYRWDPNSKIWYHELPFSLDDKKITIQNDFEWFMNHLSSFTIVDDWKKIASDVKISIQESVVKPLVESNLPDSIWNKLMPHQKTAIQKFKQQNNTILNAFSMGVGKTVTSLATIKYYNKSGIIIVPKSLISQWKQEILKWNLTTEDKIFTFGENKQYNLEFTKRKYDFYILNYEKLRFLSKNETDTKSKQKLWTEYESALYKEFDRLDKNEYILVYDEAYKIKNYKSDLFKGHKKFRNLNWSGVCVLTGTPMENNLYEFYTIINFTKPGTISYQDMEKYFVFRTGWGQPIFRNLELFNKMASSVMYHVTKEQVKSDLPKLVQEYRFVEHSKEAIEMKNKLLSNAPSVFEIYSLMRVLDSYLDPTDNQSKYFSLIKHIEHTKKYEELLDVLEEIGDKQILVFTAYEKTAVWLKDKLLKEKFKVDYVSSVIKDKEIIKQKFISGELQIVIATSVWERGQDFPTIDYLINWDFPLNPSTYAQRRDRIYRINSENPKLVINLISNIIEDSVYELVKSKIENIEVAVEGTSEKDILNALAKKWGMKVTIEKVKEEIY